MLQQTQVDRVAPKFEAFLRRFPTLERLAAVRLRDVLAVWSGLGYNSRARRLWESAKLAVARHGGKLPCDIDALRSLPGVGPYTAAAVASIAFGERVPAIDTNARRVLGRALGGAASLTPAALRRIANKALPQTGAGEWNQALMDIGALFCRATPRCGECPLRNACRWAAKRAPSGRGPAERGHQGPRPYSSPPYLGSRRYYRGRIVHALTRAPALSLGRLGPQVKEGFQKSDLPWLLDLVRGLQRDGLLALDERSLRARLP